MDNRLIFGSRRLCDLPPYEFLLDDGFYGKPIVTETQPDQDFLGFMLDQSLRAHLLWPNQCVPGPLAFLGFTTQGPAQ